MKRRSSSSRSSIKRIATGLSREWEFETDYLTYSSYLIAWLSVSDDVKYSSLLHSNFKVHELRLPFAEIDTLNEGSVEDIQRIVFIEQDDCISLDSYVKSMAPYQLLTYPIWVTVDKANLLLSPFFVHTQNTLVLLLEKSGYYIYGLMLPRKREKTICSAIQ